MSKTILQFTKNFPKKILVKSEDLTLEGISQYQITIENEDLKPDALIDLLANSNITHALIYCNTKSKVVELEEAMNKRNKTVSAMHGELEQEKRD